MDCEDKDHKIRRIYKRNTDFFFSEQARIILRNSEIPPEDVIDWFAVTKGVSIGGGNIVEYLEWREAHRKHD